jgi:hypothetical protein
MEPEPVADGADLSLKNCSFRLKRLTQLRSLPPANTNMIVVIISDKVKGLPPLEPTIERIGTGFECVPEQPWPNNDRIPFDCEVPAAF